MIKKILIYIFIVSFIYPSTFGISLSSLNGNISYDINGKQSGGWRSKLEFPVDTKLITLEYTTEIMKYNLNVGVTSGINGKETTFKDSDWEYSKRDEITMYSESKMTSDFKEVTIELTSNKNTLIYGAGVNIKRIQTECIGYVYPNSNNVSDKKSLEYEVNYFIPYVLIGTKLKNERVQLSNILKLSPYTISNDKDIHILRDKISKSNTTGYNINLQSSLDLLFKTSTLSFVLDLNKMETKGTQTQWYKDEIIGTGINSKLTNEELRLTILYSKLFKYILFL